MEAVQTQGDPEPGNTSDLLGGWLRWWTGGTPTDRGFVLLSACLVGAGYYDSWLVRNVVPIPVWQHVPVQVAWLATTVYLGAISFVAWRRGGRLETAVPEGYGPSVVGLTVFLVGILISGWWGDALGEASGVPAIFRLPNLLQIAGGSLVVIGPLRASAARGELLAGPTAVASAALLLAAVTFFTQFDHPYIDRYAAVGMVVRVVEPNPVGAFDFRDEILGALGLMMQAATVTGVIMWTLRQSRLPVGSVTVILLVTTVLTATQLGNYRMLVVGLIVGVFCDVALWLARPRADRILSLHLFAGFTGFLLSGVYLVYIGRDPGTWWPMDMTYGAVVSCALVGALISYVVFPGADATRAASVLWPALAPGSSAEAPDVTVERVEHALKVLASTRDLAESPLIGLRSIASPTPVELRKTMVGAIEHLRTSSFQLDAQAGQILDLYYVRRIGGHYAVTMRVGLSRASYFNRRSYGVRRLVDRLRELEESAATV
ncbi:MAG TPA: hypothetical protein VGT01_11795 [Candidatus Dormibacteraeota bacterium]|nr:hypothetical protein [Candidatus Dormibacteraeota bacterium]HEV2476171.1 hypothetical protein [Candidatus Dormibacteraeota bacterium]